MSFNDVLPLIVIVAFWALLFVFAFIVTRAALRVPTEAEVEAQPVEAEHAHASHAR